jgi:hypothetical protein
MQMRHFLKYVLLPFGLILAAPVAAQDIGVERVSVEKVGMVWNVHVTLRHPDVGWDHYADAWEILDAGGKRIALRELRHPNPDGQAFTRSLSGVVIPDGTRVLFVRSRCSRKGWSDVLYRVPLEP